jgi:hypothetical protein
MTLTKELQESRNRLKASGSGYAEENECLVFVPYLIIKSASSFGFSFVFYFGFAHEFRHARALRTRY